LRAAATKLGEAVAYRSAGTVEFVFDANSGAFYFLEVNTRLQVEHCVTEEVFGVDLLGYMLRLAAGDLSMFDQPLAQQGHAIQARLYAEDPARNYQPSSGLLTEVVFPEGVRVETWPNDLDENPFTHMFGNLIPYRITRATVHTDAGGSYRLTLLNAGTYQLKLTHAERSEAHRN